MIIAIESASTDPSVAVAESDGTVLRADAWSVGQRQPHELLPRLLVALELAGGSLGEVTGVGIGTGPGSFTGLRVGMSVAKGLAFALGRPIVGVPSLVAWLAAEPEVDAAATRAGARDAYLLLRGEAMPRIVDRDELAATSGRLVAPAELVVAFGLGNAIPPRGAASVVAAEVAAQLNADPAGDDLDRLEPVYLRAPRGIGPSRAKVS
ncbi:MAG TPA: tRNA (adenosine(37)-N6)-threonylcarbamoyltransferase complex dimerization subunit type 1 TsaB [Candidatus Limnocylindrales bacterium]|nr:tRNA (adenosine(37)-N6)-threonylcarbamoyltransferase complex dimerization subunit type 1 TsaB [Candidatus Limnocylindrales bacterium]